MTTPWAVSLNGIVVLSSHIGWLLDYTVNTLVGNNYWAPIASIVNATDPLQLIVIETPVDTQMFRIIVLRELLGYSRIHEIYPIFTINVSPTTTTTSSPKPVFISVTKSGTPLSTSPISDNLCIFSGSTSSGKTSGSAALASSAPTCSATPASSSEKVTLAATIVSGVFGGLFSILLITLVTLLLLKWKRKAAATQDEKDDSGPENLSNAFNAASPISGSTP